MKLWYIMMNLLDLWKPGALLNQNKLLRSKIAVQLIVWNQVYVVHYCESTFTWEKM